MKVINRIAECPSANRHTLYPEDLRYLMIHRQSLARQTDANPIPIPDDELDGPMLTGKFSAVVFRTGGLTPYPVLILADGTIEQLLPLSIRGAHARIYNRISLAVGVVGNTDERPMTDKQYESLVWVCQRLTPINGGLRIVGHTDMPGATRDPSKRCPGRYLSIDSLERRVKSTLLAEQAGFVV